MFKSLLFVALFALSSLFITPSAAEAKPARVAWNGKTVEIVESLPSSWDVKGAAADIDWYTGSKYKIVKSCSGNNDCLAIKTGYVKGKPYGWYSGNCKIRTIVGSSKPPTKFCWITIDVKDAAKNKRYGYYTKRWLVRHEIGHSVGLRHQSKCVSTMYEYNRCKGKVPPNTFTSAERAIMRKK